MTTSQPTDDSAATTATTTGEIPASRAKDEIVKEAKRIEEDTLYSSKGHFAASYFWSNFHLWMGVPTAVLAGIVAALALSGEGLVGGAVAIVIAGLTAITTFINPNEKASAHLAAGNNFDALSNRARIFWTIDCWQEDSDRVLTEIVKDLSNQKAKLNMSSPQIPGWAYRKGRKGIEAGEAQHAVDKE